MYNFKKLKIWQESKGLVKEIYALTWTFPDFEKFGLVSQMNRCAVSIPSNISERTNKSTNKHFNSYLENSLGSAFELETQLIVAFDQNYLNEEKFIELETKIIYIKKMISRFKSGLKL